MGNDEFERGGVYRAEFDDNSYSNLVGVRKETLSSGFEYATFFYIARDIYATRGGNDFSFLRCKVSVDRLKIKDGRVYNLEEIDTNTTWYDEKKWGWSDSMKSWLNDCGDILRKMGAKDVEDIFRGKMTWGKESKMYKVFGTGFGMRS